MGRGKFKGKPTGHRNFSTHEELLAGTSARPRTFRREEVEEKEAEFEEKKEEEEDSDEEADKRKGTQGLIEIENPNLVKSKNLKAKNVDIEKTTELSRRERLKNWVAHLIKRSQALVVLISDFRVLAREVIEKQKAHERYMRLQEQGKTDQARKDLERLALIRQQRAEAAKKRDEERAAREQKKVEVRK